MTEKIIISGSGGQGVMLLGKVIAQAAMKEGKFVTLLPSYGAEVRGGTSHNMVIISDEAIGSPHIDKADILIMMNEPSLNKFKTRIRDKGLCLVNSSLAAKYSNKHIFVLQYPFTDIAIGLGNIKVANMVALGSLLAKKEVVKLKTVESVISDIAPADKKGLIQINKQALEKGFGL
jgi:2-oxoglutarate ferredoxin oxidoreductase subunit gamma